MMASGSGARDVQLQGIQQRAADLQGMFRRAQVLAPGRAEGIDPSGSVRIFLDADGWPASIRISSRWERHLHREAVGAAVGQAFAAAQAERMAVWSAAMWDDGWYARNRRIDTAMPHVTPVPIPRLRSDEQPRSLDELAEEMISAVTEAIRRPASRAAAADDAGVGSVAGGRLVLTIGPSVGLTCVTEPRWVAQQTAASLTDALGAALTMARAALDSTAPLQPEPDARLDRLLAEALAVLDGCANPGERMP